MRHPVVWGLVCLVLIASAYVTAARGAQDGSAPAQAADATPAYGAVSNGLQIGIALDKPSYRTGEAVSVTVTLRNAGTDDLVLDLGMMLANGKTQVPDAVGLVLADAAGAERRLALMAPGGGIAGRVDDYIVPLRAGSTYTLQSHLDEYWCEAANEWHIKPAPGQYTLAAVVEGRGAQFGGPGAPAALMPIWTGQVTSKAVAFTVSAQ